MFATTIFIRHPNLPLAGQAFGEEAAGPAPGPASGSDNEFAKALRQAGFPEVESKVSPETITNKVLTGVQKRILKLDDMATKLDGFKDMSLVSKILFSICFLIELFQVMSDHLVY